MLAVQEISWGSLMSLVGEGVTGEGKAWAKERAGIKERWREINAAISELRDTQCSWTIPDASLRANMKDAIAEDFVPLYKVSACQSCRTLLLRWELSLACAACSGAAYNE